MPAARAPQAIAQRPAQPATASSSRFSGKTIAATVVILLALLLFAGLAARSRKQARAAASLASQEPAAVVDNRILDQVRAALANSDSLKSDDIAVAVANSVVTLSGSVSDGSEKELAGTLARAVPGVNGLINQLQIRAGESSAPPSSPAAEAPKPTSAASTSTPEAAASTDTSAQSSDSSDAADEPAASADEGNNVRQLNNQGFQALRNHKPGVAMMYFQQVLDTHPNNKRAQIGLQKARTMRQRMQGR
jgi:hypothetical protein